MAMYETLLLIDPALGEDEVGKYVKKLGSLVTTHKGKIVKEEILGRKKLAYPVNKKTEGSYVRLELDMESTSTHAYERGLRLESKILRQMTLKI